MLKNIYINAYIVVLPKKRINKRKHKPLSLSHIPRFFSPFSNKRGPSLYVAVYRTHLLLSSFIPSGESFFYFIIFSNLLLFTWSFQSWYPDFSAQKKEKKKKGNWKSSNLFFFLFAFPFTEFRYEIIRPVVEGVDWSFDLTFLHFKFNSTHPFKRFTLQINSFHICTSSFVVLG